MWRLSIEIGRKYFSQGENQKYWWEKISHKYSKQTIKLLKNISMHYENTIKCIQLGEMGENHSIFWGDDYVVGEMGENHSIFWDIKWNGRKSWNEKIVFFYFI